MYLARSIAVLAGLTVLFKLATSKPPSKSHHVSTYRQWAATEKEKNSDEIAKEQLAEELEDDSFFEYQKKKFIDNPQWFIQPGSACIWELSHDDLFIEKYSKKQSLPTDGLLRDVAKIQCIGSKTPGDAFEGVVCSPEANICRCDDYVGTWDAEDKFCKVIPGGLCFKYGRGKAQCAKGSSCKNSVCVCDQPNGCQERVRLGPVGNQKS